MHCQGGVYEKNLSSHRVATLSKHPKIVHLRVSVRSPIISIALMRWLVGKNLEIARTSSAIKRLLSIRKHLDFIL